MPRKRSRSWSRSSHELAQDRRSPSPTRRRDGGTMDEQIEIIRSMGFTHLARDVLVKVRRFGTPWVQVGCAFSWSPRLTLSCTGHARTPRLCAPGAACARLCVYAQALQESNGSLDAAIDMILALPPPEDVPDASLLAPSTGGHGFAEPPSAAVPTDSRQLPPPEAVAADAAEADADDNDEDMAQILRFAGHTKVGRSVPGAASMHNATLPKRPPLTSAPFAVCAASCCPPTMARRRCHGTGIRQMGRRRILPLNRCPAPQLATASLAGRSLCPARCRASPCRRTRAQET